MTKRAFPVVLLLAISGCAGTSAPHTGPVPATPEMHPATPDTQPVDPLLTAAPWVREEWPVQEREQTELVVRQILRHDPANREAIRLREQLLAYYQPARLRTAAEAGDVKSMVRLAECLAHGWSIEPDPQAAYRLCGKAAEAGSPRAATLLGQMLLGGNGVEKDEARGLQFLRLAAEAGDSSGMVRLAEALLHGPPSIRDRPEALVWLRNAAEDEDTRAMRAMVAAYSAGLDMDRDPEAEEFWNQRLEGAWREQLRRLPMSDHVATQLANHLIRLQRIDEALTVLRDAAIRMDDPWMMQRIAPEWVTPERWDRLKAWAQQHAQGGPSAVPCLNLLGYLSIVRKDLEAAVGYAGQALALDPGNPTALLIRGLIRMSQRQFEAALPDLEAARNAWPDDAVIPPVLARTYGLAGRPADLIAETRRILSRRPEHGAMRAIMVSALMEQRLFNEARQVIVQGARYEPLSPVWPSRLAEVFRAQGDTKQAIACADMARHRAPADHLYLARLLELLARTPGGNTLILKLTEHLPEPTQQTSTWLVRILRAEAIASTGKEDDVAEAWQAAMDAVDAMDVTGVACRDEAESLATRMLKAVGADRAIESLKQRQAPIWRVCMLTIYSTTLRWQEGIALAAKVAGPELESLPPGLRLAALTAAAAVCTKAPEQTPALLEQSRTILELALQQIPLSVEARITLLNNLACVLGELTPPRLDAALAFGEEAYQLMRSRGQIDGEVCDTYGWALVQSGKVAEGIEILKTAAQHSPTLADPHYHLGAAFRLEQRNDLALQHHRRAYDLLVNAQHPVHRRLRSRVEQAIAALESAENRED